MLFRCCGSGSNGNSYALTSESGEILALEVGVKMSEFKKMIDWRISDVSAAIISHGHSDHSRYIQDFLDMGIDVYMPYTVKAKYGQNNAIQIEPMKPTKIGFATVTAFEVPHTTFDRETGQLVPCVNYGYYIEADGQRILWITDFEYPPLSFRKRRINHLICEVNYCDELVDREEANYTHRLRGHMAFSTFKDKALRQNMTSALRTVIMCHLSDTASNREQILSETQAIVGDGVKTYIAEKGLCVNLSIFPWED